MVIDETLSLGRGVWGRGGGGFHTTMVDVVLLWHAILDHFLCTEGTDSTHSFTSFQISVCINLGGGLE